MTTTRIILLRHGETEANRERRFAGSTDVELTSEGRTMAESAARRFRAVRIDALHVSPLLRCAQTAEEVSRVSGLKPRVVPEIRELDFGDWEMLSLEEVHERDAEGFTRWISDDAVPAPGGESWAELGARVGEWWAEVAERYEGRTVLAVTHGGVILWLARHVAQAPYQAMIAFEIDPCSITILQSRRGLWRIRSLNDTTHIRDPLLDGPPPTEMPP